MINAQSRVAMFDEMGKAEYPALRTTGFTAAPVAPATASIAGSAMLVEFAVSQWTGKKLDKQASDDVTTGNSAKRGIARVHKDIMGDCEELRAVHKFTSEVRTSHYNMTLPWSDSGIRILPTKQYFKYTEAMNAMQTEFYALVDRFIYVYQWKISEAQAALGGLFNPDEYPSTDALRSKFSMRTVFIPLPEAGDWRVDIGKEGNKQLQEHYQSYYKQALGDAMGDIWTRLKEALTRASDRLDFGSGEVKKIFRDSLVTNIMELVDIMDACNLTNDTDMTTAAQILRDALTGIDASDLREDAALRRATKARVDEVLKGLPTLM
jgi:hypothetical protein